MLKHILRNSRNKLYFVIILICFLFCNWGYSQATIEYTFLPRIEKMIDGVTEKEENYFLICDFNESNCIWINEIERADSLILQLVKSSNRMTIIHNKSVPLIFIHDFKYCNLYNVDLNKKVGKSIGPGTYGGRKIEW